MPILPLFQQQQKYIFDRYTYKLFNCCLEMSSWPGSRDIWLVMTLAPFKQTIAQRYEIHMLFAESFINFLPLEYSHILLNI
jgi:hypothetical protein